MGDGLEADVPFDVSRIDLRHRRARKRRGTEHETAERSVEEGPAGELRCTPRRREVGRFDGVPGREIGNAATPAVNVQDERAATIL